MKSTDAEYETKVIAMRDSKNNSINFLCAVLAVIYAALYLVARRCSPDGELPLAGMHINNSALKVLLVFISLTLCFFAIIRLLFFTASKAGIDRNVEKGSSLFNRHAFVISFIAVVITWLPVSIINYPGTPNPDALSQLRQYFSGDYSEWSTHQPPASTFIMGALVDIGQHIGNANLGMYLYLLLNVIAAALIIAYAIRVLRNELHASNGIIIAAILFYTINPMWWFFSQYYEKSLLYAELASLMTIMLIPVVKRRSLSCPTALLLSAVCIVMSLLRNNGIYAAVPTLLIIVIYMRGGDRRHALMSLALTLICMFCVTSVLYGSLGIRKGSIKEMLSLPFQQTARYVKYYDDEVTAQEKEAIDNVLDYDVIRKRYKPEISDPVKNTYRGDNTKLPEYFKTWMRMFVKHPSCYVKATLCGIYGYLAPVTPELPSIITGYKGLGIEDKAYKYGIQIKDEKSESVQFLYRVREKCLHMPMANCILMPGLYTWVVILCALTLMWKKKWTGLIVLVPSMVNILVCMASPLANSIRYALPVMMLAPVLIIWMLHTMQSNNY